MAFDEEVLVSRFNLHKLSVHQSTHISNRVQSAVQALDSHAKEDDKPVILILTAKGRAVSKLVGITEIAKRDLATKGVKCFQYTALSSVKAEVARQPRKPSGLDHELGVTPIGDGNPDDEDDHDEVTSEDAFQTMREKGDEGTKEREIPVVTVYLSAIAVKELKDAFG
ncbi:hypothetical protein MBLNU230_g5663t1 [Neophaeotheca triangularis]